MNTQNVRMMGGANDNGAWARAIDVARRMFAANIWDGQQVLIVMHPSAVHHLVCGLEQMPVTQLVAGKHYEIVFS